MLFPKIIPKNILTSNYPTTKKLQNTQKKSCIIAIFPMFCWSIQPVLWGYFNSWPTSAEMRRVAIHLLWLKTWNSPGYHVGSLAILMGFVWREIWCLIFSTLDLSYGKKHLWDVIFSKNKKKKLELSGEQDRVTGLAIRTTIVIQYCRWKKSCTSWYGDYPIFHKVS